MWGDPRLVVGWGTTDCGGTHTWSTLPQANRHSVTQFAGTPNISAIQDGIGTSATFNRPFGVWGDGKSLYVTDAQSIRRVALGTAEVRTIAGGTISGARDGAGIQAQFAYPQELWGSGGILYIADTGNAVIRQLNTASNEVTTLAGSFGAFGKTDGTADSARFTFPTALWGDNATHEPLHNTRRPDSGFHG